MLAVWARPTRMVHKTQEGCAIVRVQLEAEHYTLDAGIVAPIIAAVSLCWC